MRDSLPPQLLVLPLQWHPGNAVVASMMQRPRHLGDLVQSYQLMSDHRTRTHCPHSAYLHFFSEFPLLSHLLSSISRLMLLLEPWLWSKTIFPFVTSYQGIVWSLEENSDNLLEVCLSIRELSSRVSLELDQSADVCGYSNIAKSFSV
jgi:hypothetical protein